MNWLEPSSFESSESGFDIKKTGRFILGMGGVAVITTVAATILGGGVVLIAYGIINKAKADGAKKGILTLGDIRFSEVAHSKLDNLLLDKELEAKYNELSKKNNFYNYQESLDTFYLLLYIINNPVGSKDIDNLFKSKKFDFETGLFTVRFAKWSIFQIGHILGFDSEKGKRITDFLDDVLGTSLGYFALRGGIYTKIFNAFDLIATAKTDNDIKKVEALRDSIKDPVTKALITDDIDLIKSVIKK